MVPRYAAKTQRQRRAVFRDGTEPQGAIGAGTKGTFPRSRAEGDKNT